MSSAVMRRASWFIAATLPAWLALAGCRTRTDARSSNLAEARAPAATRSAAPSVASTPPASASTQPPGDGDAHAGHAGYHMSFADTARFAGHFDDPARDAWQMPAHVIELLDVKPGHVVADVGAGTGYFEGALNRAVGPNGRVLALDAEPEMVRHLSERARTSGWPSVVAKLVPPGDPGLEPNSCDRILIVDTWHHIDERARYAQKLAAALKPQGRLLIVDFTRESDLGPPQKHRISPDEVVRELEAGGLGASVLPEKLPKQYAVLATHKP